MDPGSKTPTHNLDEVKESVRVGFVHYSLGARDGARRLELDRADIDACVGGLAETDFHKSMPARVPAWVGAMQDVYRPIYRGIAIYVKFQLWPGKRVHIVSFKRKDTSDDTE
jgi:hypothetical protein